MYGGGRRPTGIPRSEQAGSPIITYNFHGGVGNMNSGINNGTINQSASQGTVNQSAPQGTLNQTASGLELPLFRIVWDSPTIALSSGGVENGSPAALGDIRVEAGDAGFAVVSIDDYSDFRPGTRPHNPLYEIYVCTMLAEGHGLPCWHPRPSEPEVQPKGVIPGDVGTYSEECGFQRIFNLWDDNDTRQLRKIAERTRRNVVYRSLRGKAVTFSNELHKGETLVRGASVLKLPLSPPEAGSMYEFHRECTTQPGALLTLTSSANKEATNDPVAMEEYIKQNAEAIYIHASSFRTIGERESLYIITGSIKSDSWAMAAYDTHAGSKEETLRLVPVSGVGDGGTPEYEWRSHGSVSRARSGRSIKPGVKDQALFLQGFKVAFSPRFRSRLNSQIPPNNTPGAPGPDDKGNGRRIDRWRPYDRGSRPGGNRRSSSGGGRWTAGHSGSRNHPLPTGLQEQQSQDSTASPTFCSSPCSITSDDSGICLAGDTSIDCSSSHPSDLINAHLLGKTGCDIAICHDDAWRSLLKLCHALVVEEGLDLADIPARLNDSGNRAIHVEDGVAFLLPANPDHEADRGESSPPRQTLESVPNTARFPQKSLTVVPDFRGSDAMVRRRSYESPQSTLTVKPPWNCSTPTLPSAIDTIPMLLETDVVIFVLGTTGSGRSTFINALVPGETARMRIGDSGSLQACTTAVDHQTLDDTTLRVALGITKDYRIVLVDTPGFNNGGISDSSILRDIAGWSQQWMPAGGCRVGVILLQDITVPSNECLDSETVAKLRASFRMAIASSKCKYESRDRGQKLHDALASKWEKPSKKAKFYSFRESKDAREILEGLLSDVENSNKMANIGSVFQAMADGHKCREIEFSTKLKREKGWKGIVRSLATFGRAFRKK